MRAASWLCASLALANLSGCCCGREIFLPEKGTKESQLVEADRSVSLGRLLRHLATEYFEDCVLSLIYDPNYEAIHPVDFRAYFKQLPFAFTQESLDMSKGKKSRKRRSDKCTNYMIFLYDITAIKHVLARDVSSKIIVISADSAWDIKDFLKSDVARYYANLLVVCHSISRKNGNGAYLLYTNKLYADGTGASQPLLLASWLDSSLSRNRNLFEDKLKRGFMGHRLLVSVAENRPFAIKRSSSSHEDVHWDGLEVRLLHLAGAYLNFSLEFTEPLSRQLSASLEAAKADVAQGLSSMAIGGIYHTIEVADTFDVTTPHYSDCASFISLASNALPKYRAILGPFQPVVWVLLCISYFALIVPMSYNSNYTITSLIKHPSGLNNMFWFIFSTYTNSFMVKSPLLNYGIAKDSITMLMGIYWIFTIIITACYTGSIIAFITLPMFPDALETAEDYAHHHYQVATLDHNGWEKWFNVSQFHDDPILKKLFRKAEYVPTLLEGVQNASRAYFWPYAFLGSRTALDYLVQTDFAPDYATKRSLMHLSNECFLRYQVVQLFPSKSLYTAKMNKFVTLANEHGLLDEIISSIDWEEQRIATTTGKKVTKGISHTAVLEDRVLSVEDTEGMFIILGLGVLVALLSLSLEKFNSCLQARIAGPTQLPDDLDCESISENADPIYNPIRCRPRYIRGSI